MKYKSYYLLCLFLVILDQLTKQIVVSLFALGESMVINSYLSWTYIQNTGAAFSILSGGGAIQKTFLLGVSLFVSAMVMVWIHKTPAIRRQRLFGQFLLLSGALGNLLDRAQYGYVVDFIDVHYQNYYWPVFNVADSLIFIGVILILFERRQPAL
jgi:signal peptidase II